ARAARRLLRVADLHRLQPLVDARRAARTGHPHRARRLRPLSPVAAGGPRLRSARGGSAAVTPKLNRQAPGRELKWRYVALGAAMILGLFVLLVQLYRLQVVRGEEFAARSVANFVKETRILADRGMIRDARGQVLVQNRPSFDVFVTPAFCQKCADEVLPRLGELLGWSEPILTKAIEDV